MAFGRTGSGRGGSGGYRLDGDDAVRKVFTKFSEEQQRLITDAMTKNIRQLFREVTAIVPVDTGDLRSDIGKGVWVDKARGVLTGEVYVDSGSRQDLVKARIAEFGGREGGKRAGYVGRHYLVGTVASLNPLMFRRLKAAWTKAIKMTQRRLT